MEAWWEGFFQAYPNGLNCSEQNDNLIEISLKVCSKNTDIIKIIEKADQLALKYKLIVQSHGGLGHGITRLFLKGEKESLTSFIEQLRRFVAEKYGFVVITHMPEQMRKEIDVWGEKPAYLPILKGIKQQADPNKILNCSRFIGGI